jgi:hypothetical protein
VSWQTFELDTCRKCGGHADRKTEVGVRLVFVRYSQVHKWHVLLGNRTYCGRWWQ